MGGYTGTVPLRSILAYTPGRGVRVAAEMPRPLRYAAVAAVGGHLLIAGGTSGTTARSEILSFDPASGRVRRIGRLPSPVTHAAGAALGGRFYVLGGRGVALDAQRATIEAVDPATGRVSRAGRLPAALSDLSAATLATGVTVLGGRDAGGRVARRDLDPPGRGLMRRPLPLAAGAATAVLAVLGGCGGSGGGTTSTAGAPDPPGARPPVHTTRPAARAAVPRAGRIPPLLDRRDVYAAERPGRLSPVVRNDPARIYVPELEVGHGRRDLPAHREGHRPLRRGALPQHVTPSWDLRTLWVTNDLGNTLTPIDPRTGHHGRPVPVEDPYNLYFTADGRRAIVVAEAHRELDFRDAARHAADHRLPVPQCKGVDHMDYTADGRRALVSCEFSGSMVVVDLRRERVTRTIGLTPSAMPQDVKLSPDGRIFYVADMTSDGVWIVDARRLRARASSAPARAPTACT